MMGGLATPRSVAAQTVPDLPPQFQLIPGADTQTWTQRPTSQKSGPVNVVVHINEQPLATVGRFWTHQQRQAHVQKIRDKQNQVIPQVQALGGNVVGRFTHVSAGLAVAIDASRLDELSKISNVVTVRTVGDYQLDLTDTVPWIGATPLQQAGITGRHPLTGQGLDVAVIDSGVDFTHAKLGGPGTREAYLTAYCGAPDIEPSLPNGSPNPACTAHSSDPDPELIGPNALKVKGGTDWVGEGWPVFSSTIEPDANPIDFEGHGTHVADIIGGLPTTPGAGDQGVAPGVNIWGFKACSAVSSSCNGLALLLAVDDALDLDNSDYGACDPMKDEGCTTFDPADVINMSLGSPYGQAEDDLTHFSNIASFYGSVVVVSAGNSADKPYIVGSPSAADGTISVAQSTVPSDKLFRINIGSDSVPGFLQPWSPPLPAAPGVSGAVQYGNGAGGNLLGCTAFAPGSLAGRVLLVDRGGCAVSIKGSNGAAAGAVMVLVANNQFSNTPPVLGFGGGSVTAPTLTITQNDGNLLKAQLGQTASASNESFIALQDDIVATSSRGPRIADGSIKPDIAAPGASVSAIAGSGNEKEAFGGTSGAAPMVSGAAALMIEKLERAGILRDANPGVVVPGLSVANLVRAMLMNTANPNTFIGGSAANGGSGFLAPITLQGAGRVDALAAYASSTIAIDVTDLYNFAVDGWERDDFCTVSTPPTAGYLNALIGLVTPEYYNGSHDCIVAGDFGNEFFRAWNRVSGSLSFGYDGVSGTMRETRKVLILNMSGQPRSYNLSSAFRYADDENKGVRVTASPARFTLQPAAPISAENVSVDVPFAKLVDVTINVNARNLRDWTLNAGEAGGSGTNIYCNDPATCPTLTIFEYDGFLTINGGAGNLVRMPWQILPKKAAGNTVLNTNTRQQQVRLFNAGRNKAGATEVFSLVDISPNQCDVRDEFGNCLVTDYSPGIIPGLNQTAIDLKEVGVRCVYVPGQGANLGFPNNDSVLEFGITVYDKPFRTSHNYPVEFDVYIDSNRDGVDDYVVFNGDLALNASDGRNAVFVADVNPADGTRPLRPYFFTNSSPNSQNWILSVPAGAVDVDVGQPFNFQVLAVDAYFTGQATDISPANGSYHTYQSDLPRFAPTTQTFTINPRNQFLLRYEQPGGGAEASPSQIGLLYLYRDAEVGQESNISLLAR
jgi:subtilisin family serine protease